MGKPSTRPRVEGDREGEILDAALGLLLDVGYDRLTMDAVAREARASKATLYRRWETKGRLVLDALVKAKNVPEPQLVDTGSLRGDLIGTFCGSHGMADSRATQILGAVVTALTNDPEFARLFRQEFIGPKIDATRAIYRRAQERGEVSDDLDLDVISPALAGVLLHRAYVMGIPPDDATVTRVVDHLILPAATCGPGACAPAQPVPEKESHG